MLKKYFYTAFVTLIVAVLFVGCKSNENPDSAKTTVQLPFKDISSLESISEVAAGDLRIDLSVEAVDGQGLNGFSVYGAYKISDTEFDRMSFADGKAVFLKDNIYCADGAINEIADAGYILKPFTYNGKLNFLCYGINSGTQLYLYDGELKLISENWVDYNATFHIGNYIVFTETEESGLGYIIKIYDLSKGEFAESEALKDVSSFNGQGITTWTNGGKMYWFDGTDGTIVDITEVYEQFKAQHSELNFERENEYSYLGKGNAFYCQRNDSYTIYTDGNSYENVVAIDFANDSFYKVSLRDDILLVGKYVY